MEPYDFDLKTQKIFNRVFSEIPSQDWRKWLNINDKEEYLELCIQNSKLININNLFDLIKTKETKSSEFSINLNEFLTTSIFKNPPILCHTSGTTSGSASNMKWFHMNQVLIKNLWAPGMRAIFESSGLDSEKSAVIFVPSRMKNDGLYSMENQKYISLYSSEFSQRLVVSLIVPKSYVFYPYKAVYDLDVISKILALPNIAVVSAPAATILKWADVNKLKPGIQKYLSKKKYTETEKDSDLFRLINKEGIDDGVRKVQSKLSDKISKAVLIFSISSLDETNWNLIRDFMHWKRGGEKFTNLYVGSEIGPFASSLPSGDYQISRENKMYVFPLTLPVIKYNGSKEIISNTDFTRGKLYISRKDQSEALININTGDIISIKENSSIPLIGGDILRAQFKLKYQIEINNKIKNIHQPEIYAGDYFTINQFEIQNSRRLLNCLKSKLPNINDSLVLLEEKDNPNSWKLILSIKNSKREKQSHNEVKQKLLSCPDEVEFKTAIKNSKIDLILFYEELVNYKLPREKILEKVRAGKMPKGILKKWPLYVIRNNQIGRT